MKKKLFDVLRHYPVFTAKDIASALNKSRAYAYVVAHRLKKARLIHEIEKGKYTLEAEPMLVASWIVWPSYITGWSALNFHKLTEQLPRTIHVVTTRKRKNKIILFGNAKIEFIKVRKNIFFAFIRISYQGKDIFIAEPEKAIADAIALKKMTQTEAKEIIEKNVGKISRKKLVLYADRFGKTASKLRGLFE